MKRCPYRRGTLRAWAWADGQHYVLCRPCKRYMPLYLTTDIADRLAKDLRFPCRKCGQIAIVTSDDDKLVGCHNVLEPEPTPADSLAPPGGGRWLD